ncbi:MULTISPECIES: glycosyltransferase family 2 protein [unclassified Arcicella]|uniref:glycosyltransferase family 2 protein n=1 Tax=unclassified Arcicella TaxID=2644986 RepID=UPI00285D8CCC|nr:MULTISPECIES: glycosyltransferase family 2 protein [unclassified Arcicella]MDR6561623.1 glycosyltransferase involved in cell wall biosynthesis [Arcicella sp. BE51]MDR6812403.1 glycosyltransferase involved in cell wall biosynthesis [Arcicella sp. BE140]MDR6823825.1 glycosyltransferase involved in cell wall biosynthesis [Arcicella sp. BE139]
MRKFDGVTLLVTHYNRSSSLERLLKSFKDLDCVFEDIVVSDDGSKEEHQAYLRKIQPEYSFRLITTPKNKGLGNNLNKGQDAVVTPYTLYVQEDFVPSAIFPTHFEDALRFMNEDKSLDMVRFYAYIQYPYLKYFDKGYSEMLYKPWYLDYHKIYYYSDHPHLRRRNYFEKFGRYAEGIKGDRTEYRMCLAFIQNKGKALFFNEYKSLFDQVNSADEPTTMSRGSWTTSENPVIQLVRYFYRQTRYNYDLLFTKYKY